MTGQVGGLVILSRPGGAKVILDGKEYGKTPIYAYPLDPGLYQIVIFKEGYNLYTEGVSVKPGLVDTLEISLVRLVGTIIIFNNPGGAKVYLNGKYQRKTVSDGSRIDNLMTQVYTFEIKRPGYRNCKKVLDVEIG